MKVEELIIDGFKSYATRTVISGWDTSFNCITGLNGSGKSNILDAICFVLGITTMSTVRAQNQQDLIYKRGQAGVTKASVTIVFDNSEKEKSPLGFEDQPKISVTRQIVLGGTSKFLINGHRAQQQSVQQLFQSVQLNINNPNFLIMQGRITKVLNMRPPEILALIEEAAGTRMFEERREKAIKTMAKKQKKVDEINDLLREEIEPKLENLRNEKRTFLEYQQTQSSLERLEKLVGAYDYHHFSRLLDAHSSGLESKHGELEELKTSMERAEFESNNLQQDIQQLKVRKEGQIQKGGKFELLEAKYKDFTQEVAKIKTLIELKQANIVEEENIKKSLEKNIIESSNKSQERMKLFQQVQLDYDKVKTEMDKIALELAKKEELLQSLQTGLSSKAGEEGGYAASLQKARAEANQGKTSAAQAQVRINYLEKLIEDEKPKTERAVKQNETVMNDLKASENQLAKLQEQMSKAGWIPGKLDELKYKESELQEEIRKLTNDVDEMKKQVSNVDFHYSRPSSNFNTSSVKGLVAQLFTLEEKDFDKATAIEVTAGGRLFQVVVDSDITASQLLKNGQLRRRVTIIPLNKINSFKLSTERLGAAMNLAPGKVNLALELIGYEGEVSKAMEYVFGSTLVCSDEETAKKVTFNPQVRAKTVTLQGDIYDPNGTLSGGSNKNSGMKSDPLVVKLQKYNSINKKLKNRKIELMNIQREIEREHEFMTKFKDLKHQMDLKEHEVELLRKKIHDSSNSGLLKKFKDRNDEVEALKQQIIEDEMIYEKANNEAIQIEKDMMEFKNNRGGKLDELKEEIQSMRLNRNELSTNLKEKLTIYQNAKIEAEQLTDDVEQLKEQIEDKDGGIEELKQSVKQLEIQHNETKTGELKALEELDEERSTLLGIDEELNAMENAFVVKQKHISQCSLDIQKLSHEIEKISKDGEQAQDMLENLTQKYEWIEEQKQYFGQEGTPYAYSGVDIKESRKNIKSLEKSVENMKKNVNSKVMNMIESVEKKEGSLRHMIHTIEKDKSKIDETIISLDEYKRNALVQTWTKVNEDFGKIFNDLLPGSFAKLVPPENLDVTQGLEVKVSLGGIWKEGLAELSGGQRSLVALSLILALLQFKPAPMYILDEVDAALDLHHTQNIGQIIKTRFKGSQFIVVSLKEGMFTNANRVFRARFQEGTSTVSVM